MRTSKKEKKKRKKKLEQRQGRKKAWIFFRRFLLERDNESIPQRLLRQPTREPEGPL